MNSIFVRNFLFFSTLLFVKLVEAEINPGLKLRTTNNGIEYASEIGRQMLSEQLAAFRIPDFPVNFNAGPGSGRAEAKNIRVVRYQPPKFSHQLKAPSSFLWETSKGLLKVRGDWSAEYKWIAKISGSGWFEVQAKDIQLKLGARFGRTEAGKPSIATTDCSAALKDLDVKIGGGLIGWVIDRFSGKIEQRVRQELESKFCLEAKKTM